jgi:hypothetical protein
MLQSLLDGVASACQQISQLPRQGSIYFHDYEFVASDVIWVAKHQKDIVALAFRRETFITDFANFVEHEHSPGSEP